MDSQTPLTTEEIYGRLWAKGFQGGTESSLRIVANLLPLLLSGEVDETGFWEMIDSWREESALAIGVK